MTPESIESRAVGRLLQHLSRTRWHIAVSLTKNCPLACRHCIVSALRGSYDRSSKTEELAHWFELGISKSHARISALTFTGGESPLADIAFKRIGTIASEHSIRCGLVTSGYFGKSEDYARAFFEEHSFLDSVTVSFDEYHEEYLSIKSPITALRAAKKNGLSISARYSGHHSSSYLTKLRELLEPEFGDIIEFQGLVYGGRAADIPEPTFENTVLSQCPTDGPHVSADGNILPCCSTIISEDTNVALSLGHISKVSLGQMLDLMDSDALMRIIRVWGWDHVTECLPKVRQSDSSLQSLGGCAQCAKLTLNPELARTIRVWADETAQGKRSSEDAYRFLSRAREHVATAQQGTPADRFASASLRQNGG